MPFDKFLVLSNVYIKVESSTVKGFMIIKICSNHPVLKLGTLFPLYYNFISDSLLGI